MFGGRWGRQQGAGGPFATRSGLWEGWDPPAHRDHGVSAVKTQPEERKAAPARCWDGKSRESLIKRRGVTGPNPSPPRFPGRGISERLPVKQSSRTTAVGAGKNLGEGQRCCEEQELEEDLGEEEASGWRPLAAGGRGIKSRNAPGAAAGFRTPKNTTARSPGTRRGAQTAAAGKAAPQASV